MEGITFVSLEQFAKLEGISEDKARGWRDRGYIAVYKVGKTLHVDKELTEMRWREAAGTLEEYNRLKRVGVE